FCILSGNCSVATIRFFVRCRNPNDTAANPKSQAQTLCCLRYFQLLEHDPEKWMPVFRLGHAPDMNESAMATPSRSRTLGFRTSPMAAETSVSRKSDAAAVIPWRGLMAAVVALAVGWGGIVYAANNSVQ